MGIRWGFVKIRPDTHEPVEGAEEDVSFDPEIWDPQELDLILVGDYKGPIMEMIETVSQEDFDPDDPDNFDSVISPNSVRQCAMHPAISPSYPAPSLELVIEKKLHSLSPGDEQWYYNGLIESANEFRKFITDAANHGYALLNWVAG